MILHFGRHGPSLFGSMFDPHSGLRRVSLSDPIPCSSTFDILGSNRRFSKMLASTVRDEVFASDMGKLREILSPGRDRVTPKIDFPKFPQDLFRPPRSLPVVEFKLEPTESKKCLRCDRWVFCDSVIGGFCFKCREIVR